MGKKTKKQKSTKILKWKKTTGRNTLPAQAILQNAFSLCHQGDTPGAEQLFNTLQNTQSKDPTFLNQLGILAHMLGKSDIGLNYLHESINLHPTAPFFNNLGLVQEQSGDLDASQHSYEQAISLDPDFPQSHYNLGNTLQKKSKFKDAVKSYHRAIHLKQDYESAYSNMGNAQRMLGELDEGEASCLAALKINPDYTEAISTWCNILLQKESPEKVLALCEKTLGFVQKRDLVYGTLGDTLADLGNKEEAFNAYRKTLKFSAKPGKIYLRMSMLKKFHSHDNDLLSMERSYELLTDKNDKQFTCFAIGKAYEDLENYQKAFQYIEEGNRLARTAYTYSIDRDRAFFEKLKTSFDSEFLLQRESIGHRDPTPIFIVGMPRSGTTLIEQILASHSQVYGAGELHALDNVIKKTLQQKRLQQVPDGIKQLKPQDYEDIGIEYLFFLKSYDESAIRIVDKMPQNFFWVGLIHLILPDAKIIHCKRDPMDTCWSMYKNIFDVPHQYAQDLFELGQYYTLYLDLMDHWKKILFKDIYEVEYEKLVQNQETETRKLLKYCNLPWEDACLHFHKSERKVLTSSMSQVRNPIYSSSVKKWKCFEKELQPLLDSINNGKTNTLL